MFERLLGKTKNHVGLDIGSGAVKMIQARRTGEQFNVIAAAIADVSQQKITAVGYKAAAADAINDCLEQAICPYGDKILAVSSISGPEVIVRTFDFPPIPEEDIKNAVELEASQVCPVDIKQCALDYQILNGNAEYDYQNETQKGHPADQEKVYDINTLSNNGRIKGILVAAPKNLLESRVELLKSTGTHCCLLDVNPLAALNCFHISEPLAQKNKDISLNSAALLDIGKNSTNIVITDCNNIPFVRDFSYGSKDIISQLAENSKLSEQKILDQLIASPQDINIEDYTQKLSAAAARLTTDINETLRYYATRNDSIPVENIYLFGTFARTPRLREILDGKLPANVLLWNPFENIHCDADENTKTLLETNGPAFAVAAGLAARTF